MAMIGCTNSKSHRSRGPSAKSPAASHQYRAWNSSKRQMVRTTAYSHKENEPGAYGRLNAIGTTLRYGRVRSAAADWSRYPMGTQFRIVGERHLYEIDDYGSALVGTSTIDLYKPNLRLMNEWGARHVEIEIVRWGSFQESADFLSKKTRYPHVNQMYRSILAHMRRG